MGTVKCPECGAQANVIMTAKTSAEITYQSDALVRCRQPPADDCPRLKRQTDLETHRMQSARR